ncbi:MAG: ATP-binding protein, partial [Deltaproteobacteria bacterium]|nr:ATP-binding protein [Deltaproteobacteria bacterium]
MNEVLIISGKGGTGKTSVAAALAQAAGQAVLVDLDVDAADMHLLLSPEPEEDHDFISGHEAVINPELCTQCGICLEVCNFEAIKEDPYRVDPIACEGCKVCVVMCPDEAIEFPEKNCGQWWVSQTRAGRLVHARLFPGEENSGKLVSRLRQEARRLVESEGIDLILADGPPGIGCPVISSLSQTSLAVAVTEPTPSGKHDLLRVIDLADFFRVPVAVLVNKADLNPDIAREIEAVARQKGLPVVGR